MAKGRPNIGRDLNGNNSGLDFWPWQLFKWGVRPANLEAKDPIERASEREREKQIQGIGRRLSKIWPQLSSSDRAWLFCAAEQIAESERTKNEWNPKRLGTAHHRRLCDARISAAKLGKEIRLLFGHDQDVVVAKLVRDLTGFAVGMLLATYPIEKVAATRAATSLLAEAAQRIKSRTGRTHLKLITDLAWLASGTKGTPPSERSVRYLLQLPVTSNTSKKKTTRNRRIR